MPSESARSAHSTIKQVAVPVPPFASRTLHLEHVRLPAASGQV